MNLNLPFRDCAILISVRLCDIASVKTCIALTNKYLLDCLNLKLPPCQPKIKPFDKDSVKN